MRYSIRTVLAATLAAGLVAAVLPTTASAFDKDQQKCRAAVAKESGKYSKTVLKIMEKCHKDRDKNGGGGTDCNDLAVADTKAKIPTAQTRFDGGVAKKCVSGTPADVLYSACPAPCAGAIATFSNLVDCEICLTDANNQSLSDYVNGSPSPVPINNDDRADCHQAIVKEGGKLFKSVVKNVAKCQKIQEKEGSESVTLCTVTDFNTLVQKAYDKCEDKITDKCAGVNLPSAALDACGGTPATLFDLTVCACAEPRDAAQELVTQFLDLSGPTTTTTTVSTTTTTLGGGSHPQCPGSGELVLYSKLSNVPCASNGDCTAPRTCDPTLLICTTVADLDSGWNGAGHDADINDQIATRAFLDCPGPPSPGCGECTVTGLDPASGNCRCANDIRTHCDEPFAADADDCGGATCNCYFGAPFPLAAQGTPVCVSNRFSQDITGTADVDLGVGAITANLRTQVFLGLATDMPCPACGGKCSDDDSGCIFDSDCVNPATCVHDTPGDGIRDGLCVYDPNFHNDNGMTCDVAGTNPSFPGVIGNTAPGMGGAGYSIDCQPEVGKNISGQGLKISLDQTTGTASLGFGVDCDGAGVGTDMCPCLVCSSDQTQPCSSDAECAFLGGSCAGAPNGGGVACSTNAECTSANVGPCNNLNICAKKFSQGCATNADCLNQNVGPCDLQTCSAKGTGAFPEPTFCSDDFCTDQGGGEGECMAGPSFTYCDGLVRSDGTGINSCNNNSDCTGGYGLCTLVDPADCFLDPIEAYGSPDPDFPVAGAVFCIPPTSNGGVNDSAGLPGPGRVVSQGAARTFCSANPGTEYTPGVGGCP